MGPIDTSLTLRLRVSTFIFCTFILIFGLHFARRTFEYLLDSTDTHCLFSYATYADQHGHQSAKVIVLVIADKNPLYTVNWAVWEKLGRENRKVHVYFLVSEPSLPDEVPIFVNESTHTIHVKAPANMVPGILIKTIEALRILSRDEDRRFSYILRTNLSSMWDWERLLTFISQFDNHTAPLAAGVLFHAPPEKSFPLVSGAGILLNRDAIRILISDNAVINYSLMDDVAIGVALQKGGVKIVEMKRCDFVSNVLPHGSLDTDTSCFHWRVKNPSDRAYYDGYLFSRLYFELYGRVGRPEELRDVVRL